MLEWARIGVVEAIGVGESSSERFQESRETRGGQSRIG